MIKHIPQGILLHYNMEYPELSSNLTRSAHQTLILLFAVLVSFCGTVNPILPPSLALLPPGIVVQQIRSSYSMFVCVASHSVLSGALVNK